MQLNKNVMVRVETVEHQTTNLGVGSSNLPERAIFFFFFFSKPDNDHNLCRLRVCGLILAARICPCHH